MRLLSLAASLSLVSTDLSLDSRQRCLPLVRTPAVLSTLFRADHLFSHPLPPPRTRSTSTSNFSPSPSCLPSTLCRPCDPIQITYTLSPTPSRSNQPATTLHRRILAPSPPPFTKSTSNLCQNLPISLVCLDVLANVQACTPRVASPDSSAASVTFATTPRSSRSRASPTRRRLSSTLARLVTAVLLGCWGRRVRNRRGGKVVETFTREGEVRSV